MKKVYLFACLLFVSFVSTAVMAADKITPGEKWNDTGGTHINAHGGCVQYYGGAYYWFGEDRTGSRSNGISCYKSTDLYNWQRVGLALSMTGSMTDPEAGNDIAPGRTLERPKVVFNAKTGKWVMWIHWENGDGYGQARVCVASSDRIEGPYKFHNTFRPNDHDSRDQTIFLDDDGKCYHFCSTNMNSNMNIVELSDDFLTTTPNEVLTLLGKKYEAPAIFKVSDTYLGVFSGCTGWTPNPGRYAYTNDILGQWTYGTKDRHSDGSVGTNFCVDDYGTAYMASNSYKSQSTYVFPVQGKENAFVYMGDRWNSGNVGSSDYVWLPLSVRSGYPAVRWYDKWDLSVFDEMYRYKRTKEIVSGNTYSFLDKYSNRLINYSTKGLTLENDDNITNAVVLIATDQPYVYKIQNKNDGKFWTVTVGYAIRMANENPEEEGQKWLFELEEDGYYKIRNVKKEAYLSVSGSSTYAGSNVYLTDLGTQFSQSFAVYFDSKTYPDYETTDIFSLAYKEDVKKRMEEQKLILGVSQPVAEEDAFGLFPTVNNGSFTLTEDTEYAGEVEIVLSEAGSGRNVHSEKVRWTGSSLSLDYTGVLNDGMYLVRIITGKTSFVKKIIVIK